MYGYSEVSAFPKRTLELTARQGRARISALCLLSHPRNTLTRVEDTMRIHSRPMRLALAAVFGIAIGLSAQAARAVDKPAQKVKVFAFVEKDPSGFVDQRTQDLPASLQDIREAITKKNDWLQLVEVRELADIVIEVTQRTLVERGGQSTTNTTYDKDGKRATSRTTQTKEHD